MFETPIADPASLETLNFTQQRRPASRRPKPPRRRRARHRQRRRLDRVRLERGLCRREGPPAGRRLRLGFDRRAALRATVEVFQSSVGRRIVGNRRIAHFTGPPPLVHVERQARPPRVPVRALPDQGREGRHRRAPHHALRRSGGRFTRGRAFYRRCDLRAADRVSSPRPCSAGRRAKPRVDDRVPARLAGARVGAGAPRRQVSSSAFSRRGGGAAHRTIRLRASAPGRSGAARTACGLRRVAAEQTVPRVARHPPPPRRRLADP